MDLNQKTNLISFVVLLVCILMALGIYLYSGHIVVAILIAPPIIHWILKKRKESDYM